MRPSTYSNEEIIAAGNELLKAKTNITGYSLSIQLGGGRPERLIKVWLAHLTENQNDETKLIELSESLEAALDNVLDTIKSNLSSFLVETDNRTNELAEKRVEIERVKFLESLSELEEKLSNADAVINKNEDYIDALHIEINELKRYQQRVLKLEKRVLQLKTKEQAFTSTVADKDRIIAEQQARISELKQAA